jgi:hypothetical protein
MPAIQIKTGAVMEFARVVTFDEKTGAGLITVLPTGERLPFLVDANKVHLIVGQRVTFRRATMAINVWACDGTEPAIVVDSQGRRQ